MLNAAPPMLTACLSCGWVHGFPWRCTIHPRVGAVPAIHRQNLEVFRVGKANTLLLTPNDWSTLSNGTVDGEPTGLHRYVGENRFVFVLLNVTDGHGNLVSYDLETKDNIGAYKDLSGNGKTGYHSGATPEVGRFGLAARLSGSGSEVSVNDDDNRLDWINTSMTVSFWIRPDEDYVGGTGWKWSMGRQDLWRLGYHNNGSFHGLRFEVRDTGGGYRYVQTPYSLYAGRWVHVAATMERVFDILWYTKLTLYVNGALAAECGCTDTTAKDGTTWLYLGYDAAPGGGRFKGLVDEFRLYKTALSADSVRGLPWFLHGSNNILIPRGVFFDSKLFANLNNATQMTSGPLAGANVNGNDNKGVAHLNARVIQMVITKNATLAQAWKVLDLAATNATGVVTAFGLVVTNEFYTLGLAKEVRDLAANVVVENSGNFSAPPPSPTLWQLFWNTLAGIAGAAWNAAMAVYQFFANVANWLKDLFIGLFVGLVTNNWSYFQENVLEPLRQALEALFKFIRDLVDAILAGARSLFAPLLAGVTQWRVAILGSLARSGEDTENSALHTQSVGMVTSGQGFLLAGGIVAFITGLTALIGFLIVLTMGLAAAIAKIVGDFIITLAKTVAKAVVKNLEELLLATWVTLLSTILIGFLDVALPDSSESIGGALPWISAAISITILTYHVSKGHPLKAIGASDAVGLLMSVLGLFIGGVLGLFLTVVGFIWTWMEDDILDKLPIPRIATMFEEMATVAGMAATLYQFLEDNLEG